MQYSNLSTRFLALFLQNDEVNYFIFTTHRGERLPTVLLFTLKLGNGNAKMHLFWSFFSFLSKESTRKLTALHLLTGMKAIRSRIAATSHCSSLTSKTGNVGLELAESLLTLLWPGFPFSLDLRVCCITSSNYLPLSAKAPRQEVTRHILIYSERWQHLAIESCQQDRLVREVQWLQICVTTFTYIITTCALHTKSTNDNFLHCAQCSWVKTF